MSVDYQYQNYLVYKTIYIFTRKALKTKREESICVVRDIQHLKEELLKVTNQLNKANDTINQERRRCNDGRQKIQDLESKLESALMEIIQKNVEAAIVSQTLERKSKRCRELNVKLREKAFQEWASGDCLDIELQKSRDLLNENKNLKLQNKMLEENWERDVAKYDEKLWAKNMELHEMKMQLEKSQSIRKIDYQLMENNEVNFRKMFYNYLNLMPKEPQFYVKMFIHCLLTDFPPKL